MSFYGAKGTGTPNPSSKAGVSDGLWVRLGRQCLLLEI